MSSTSPIDLLLSCQYCQTAACKYDVMAGGLVWDDEVPDVTDHASHVRAVMYLRPIIAYRASLTRGTPRTELERHWRELKQYVPHWPGFREDRIDGEVQRRLKIHQYKEDKVLDRLLREMDR